MSGPEPTPGREGLRVVVAVRAYRGHLHPVVPLARGLVAAGHDVVVATAPELAPAVLAAGLDWVAAGLDAGTVADLVDPRPDRPGDDPDFGVFAIGTKVDDLVTMMLGEFRPDLVVREATDLAAAVAADVAGCPVASFGITSFIEPASWVAEGADRNLAAVRAAYGLDPDKALAAAYRGLYLTFVPEELDDATTTVPEVVRLRYRVFDGDDSPPEPVEPRRRPRVLVTLGTVFNDRLDLLATWCGALADDGFDVVCTLGADHDPAELDPLPAHVRVERYVAHSRLLASCDALVCHGGFNTVMGALVAGVPVVAVPLGSDQRHNAVRIDRLGLGCHLPEAKATRKAVARAVRRLVGDEEVARRLGAFAERQRRLPGVDAGVRRLELEAATAPTPPGARFAPARRSSRPASAGARGGG